MAHHFMSDSEDSENETPTAFHPKISNSNHRGISSSSDGGESSSSVATKDITKSANGEISDKEAEKLRFKRLIPPTCIHYIEMNVSNCIMQNPTFTDILSQLNITNVTKGGCNWFTWRRMDLSGEYIQEPFILVLWDHARLFDFINKKEFIQYFAGILRKRSKSKTSVFFAVYGLRSHYKKSRGGLAFAQNPFPSLDVVEDELCQLQLLHGVSSRLIEDPNELILFINQITKSIAEAPYKRIMAEAERKRSVYLREDSRHSVKIDQQNFGMNRLWQQQIAQLPKSSLDHGKAVTGVYPSPYALYLAYNSIDNKEKRETLLQDIPVGREGATKRLGPEFSKKMSLLFSCEGDSISSCIE